MLTLLDAVCCAGSRETQNDDMFGFTPRRAFVVDGATDLVDTPFSGAASDASWLAKRATAGLSVSDSEPDTRKVIREISNAAANEWLSKTDGADIPLWAQPSATMLVVSEIEGAIEITRLGDCSAYVLDSNGVRSFTSQSKADEERSVRSTGVTARNKLDFEQRPQIELLRSRRIASVRAAHVFGLDSACGDNAFVERMPVDRPAHVLAMTDGFSTIIDLYARYTGASIIAAALERGLTSIVDEIRTVETSDRTGLEFPRWKTSDDATAVLLRID